LGFAACRSRDAPGRALAVLAIPALTLGEIVP